MPKRYGQSCPVARSLEFLGERWTLLIVRDLLSGPRKFQDLQASLTGVAPTVLSHRLKILETRGIIRRGWYSDHPPRAEYALTDRGQDLKATVRALAIWGARHAKGESVVIHETCGGPIEIAYFCPTCDKTIPSAEVRRRPVTRRAAPRARARRVTPRARGRARTR